MAENDDPTSPFDGSLSQNPAPVTESGQDYESKVQEQVERIMASFLAVLPSNYVSQVNGPFYTLQFQAIAHELAKVQISAQQSTLDSSFDFTRSEFLWQMIGSLVFPGASDVNGGMPTIEGDVSYREFLQRMVRLLLRGAGKDPVQEGVELVTDADITIIEKFLGSREEGSAWSFDDQHVFEINVEVDDGTAFPSNPFTMSENASLVLEALKPAHTIYEYRHLFRDAFGPLFDDSLSWEMDSYYYDDFRRFQLGMKQISGTAGRTLTGRFLFADPTLSFDSIRESAVLTITDGDNEGVYRVTEIIAFPGGDDTTPRAYTTSPTGLTGTATVSEDIITDSSQDWTLAEEGETITFSAGPNAGTYRLDMALGANGGKIGKATGPATRVRISPSILRVKQRMPVVATAQTYTVTIDRLGVREPKARTAEDVASQFYR